MKEYRVVEIAEDARTLASDRGFLLVKEKGEEIGRIELDSVSAVICNANWTMLGTPLISKLAEYNIPLVVCDKRSKIPKCALITLDANWRQGKVLEAQARCSIPKNKSAWQSIISAKLEQQGNVLLSYHKDTGAEKLLAYSKKVKSDDIENLEGRGAALYWKELMGEKFKRDKKEDNINILFNYGYTILRACAIRFICAAGLHPSLGIHHCSATNTYRLADDIMEPFRVFVDIAVKSIEELGDDRLTAENKKRLCGILNKRYIRNGNFTSVSQMMSDTATDLAKYYLGELKTFEIKTVKSRNLM